jgi:hypothetical protein
LSITLRFISRHGHIDRMNAFRKVIIWLPLLMSVSAVSVSRAATKITWDENGLPQSTEVDIPARPLDPSTITPQPEQQRIAPPKLTGISETEINEAPHGQMTEAVLLVKGHYPVPSHYLEYVDTTDGRKLFMDTPEGNQALYNEELEHNRQSQRRVREVLAAVGGEIISEYVLLNGLRVRVPTRSIALLLVLDEIVTVEANVDRMQGGAPSVPAYLNHRETAAVTHFNETAFSGIPIHYSYPTDENKGYKPGEAIALIDNGVLDTHPELDGGTAGSKIVFRQNFIPYNASDPNTSNFDDTLITATNTKIHGTPVAGTIAGNYWKSAGVVNDYRGMAPASKLFNLKVGDPGIPSSRDNALNAISNIYSVKSPSTSPATRDNGTYTAKIAIIEQGWCTDWNGVNTLRPDGTSSLSMFVDRMFERGIVPIMPAGNAGDIPIQCANTFNGNRLFYTLTYPGDARKAVTVGATDHPIPDVNDPPSESNPTFYLNFVNQLVSGYSGHGPTYDGRVKPEILAPTKLYAPFPYKSDWATTPGYIDAYHAGAIGTSFSTPVVTGMAAVERQWNLVGLDAGYVVGYMIHQGGRDTVWHTAGLGSIDGDYPHKSKLGFSGSQQAAWKGWVSHSDAIPYTFDVPNVGSGYTMPSDSTRLNGKLVVTLWWPDRRAKAGGYWHSNLDLAVHEGSDPVAPLPMNQVPLNPIALKEDNDTGGVFARVYVYNPKINTRYTIKVKGSSVPNNTTSGGDVNPVDGQLDIDSGDTPSAPFPNQQLHYLFVTPLEAHPW